MNDGTAKGVLRRRSRSAVTAWVLTLLGLAFSVPAYGADHHIGGVEGAGGTIKGTVKFDGRQAKRKPVRMAADPFCDGEHKDGPVLNERYVFGNDSTLQNVFVWVSGGVDSGGAAPETPAVLDQTGCMYVPHVSGVVVNQELQILNSDNTLHNVNCQPKENGAFNEGMPVKGMVSSKRFAKVEQAIPFKCDVHPWMSAYLHVVDHPYFAVTGQEGVFEIHGLPAGAYQLSVWHEFDKFKPDSETVSVTVEDGVASEVTITYAPKKGKK